MTDSVIEDQLLNEFADGLRAEAAERLEDLGSGSTLAADAAIAEAMLSYLEEAGAVPAHDLCPHEDQGVRRPCRILGYSLPDDSTRLELFTAHAWQPSTSETLPGREVGRLSGWAARFFDYAAKGELARFDGDAAVAGAAARIHSELARVEDVRIHVLTDSRVRDKDVADLEIHGRRIETEVWDLERLYRVTGEEVSRNRIVVDFPALLGRPIACLEMRPPPDEYQTFLLVLPGQLVHNLYERYGAQLFEFNVRSFLQAKGTVNKGIRKTIEDHPGRFLAYNNGLTATADEVEVGSWNGETVIHRLRGLQIVNGAQTTASIHRARKTDKLPLDQVAVSMKLTLVPKEKLQEFVPLIARFANTQNPIQVADLSASDIFHQKFEALSRTVWCPGEETRWFYERARGSYQVARNRFGTTPSKKREFDNTHPKSQHFGKADLAKYLMTWWGEPSTVSKGAQKNYAAFMYGLRDRVGDGWEPDRTFFQDSIAKALLFKAAQGVVRKAKLQSYGANVVTYMIAKLAADHRERVELGDIWDAQAISPEMMNLFADWAPQIHTLIVDSAAKRNVTEWCKKDVCWDAIRSAELAITDPTPAELRIPEPTAPTSLLEPSRTDSPISACMSLDGAAWARVVAWAAANASIEDFDRKVAHTLSGYAMDGWQKEPSIKQAARGARVIEAARKSGILLVGMTAA
jgi:hypothetical protein